jgi:dTDP-glucose 4,6-dehydratase
LPDTVHTVANIIDNFKPGETYNIAGGHYHTIEELSELVLKVTGASPALVRCEDSEAMTTRHKLVDVSKAIRDLCHKDTYTLEQGLQITADWMRNIYKPQTQKPVNGTFES